MALSSALQHGHATAHPYADGITVGITTSTRLFFVVYGTDAWLQADKQLCR
jgi:hypothetical protein